jgi:trigger factor
MVENRKSKLEQQGKSLESAGGEAALREELQSEAEEMVKGHIVLMAIAKKEDLSVTNQEVEQHLFRQAIMSGQDPQQLKKYYEDNNMMFALRDSLLADRAMDLVYQSADIQEVDPAAQDQEGAETEEQPAVQGSEEESGS